MAVDYVNPSTNVWPNYSKGNVSKAGTAEEQQTMGKDQFLTLLVTQLKYQNPLQPMDDKAFIAQMAQFSTLEQLMNISDQITDMRQSLGGISSLIGKKVSWVEYVEGTNGETTVKSGVVDSVLVRDGVQFVKIGDNEVALEYIMQIENNVQEPEIPDTEGPNTEGPDNENIPNPEPEIPDNEENPAIEPESTNNGETPAKEPEVPSTDSDASVEPLEPSQQSGDSGEATP